MSANQTNVTINAVFVAARNQGKSTNVVVAAIKACKLDWSDKTAVETVGDAFKAGRISASLDVNEKTARGILASKPHIDGDSSDDRRTFAQQLAARAAISAWSSARRLAGAPNAQKGGKRKPRASKANEKKSTDKAVAADLVPAVTRAKSLADVHAYALRMAQNMGRYLAKNDKIATGDVGTLLRAFIAGASALANETPKTVLKAAA